MPTITSYTTNCDLTVSGEVDGDGVVDGLEGGAVSRTCAAPSEISALDLR
jgi:hypothetical protein